MQANAVLELLSILTLPSTNEREQDMVKVNNNLQYLVPRLFISYNKLRYFLKIIICNL